MMQVPDDIAGVAKPRGLVAQCSSIAPYSDANPAFGPPRQATLILVEMMGVRYAGLNTYSIGFDSPVDETPVAREIAAFLGTHVHRAFPEASPAPDVESPGIADLQSARPSSLAEYTRRSQGRANT